jgi:hypothetical protein
MDALPMQAPACVIWLVAPCGCDGKSSATATPPPPAASLPTDATRTAVAFTKTAIYAVGFGGTVWIGRLAP